MDDEQPKKRDPRISSSSTSRDSVLDASLEPTVVEPLDPLVGRTIGRYQILAHIAKGGTATVYRALDTVLSREVAVKILHEHLESKKEVVERFKKEALLIAQLRHSNILTVFDFLDYQGRALLVVEYMPGITLSTLIKETEKVPENIVFMIAHEILQGLKAAHEKGMVHRDIKPANILLHPEIGIKISDFGLAKISAHDDGLTKEGIFVGTPSFSSPEQIEGKALDHRSDIFSLGLTIYILATRAHAFKQKGDSTTTVWFKIVKGKFEEVRALDPSLSPELERILSRALQVEPEKRYQSAQAMLDDVEQVLRGRHLMPYQTTLKNYLKSPQSQDAFRPARKGKSSFFTHGKFLAGLAASVALLAALFLWRQQFKDDPLSTQEISAPVAQEPKVEEREVEEPEAVPAEPEVSPPVAEAPAPVEKAKPAPLAVKKEQPIPQAINLREKAEVIVFDPKNVPGYRWTWNTPSRFELSSDSRFKKILVRSEGNVQLKEMKSIAPGKYFWRAGKSAGSLEVKSLREDLESKRIAKRPVVVLSRFEDVDLELNPWTQDLQLDWSAGPAASSYRLDVGADEAFKNLIFSGSLVEKSHRLIRQWEKSQKIYWRVSYADDRGNVFLIDPVRSVNLKVTGHSPQIRLLEESRRIESNKSIQVRMIGPATSNFQCSLIAKDGLNPKWTALQRGDTNFRAKFDVSADDRWLVCELKGAATQASSLWILPLLR